MVRSRTLSSPFWSPAPEGDRSHGIPFRSAVLKTSMRPFLLIIVLLTLPASASVEAGDAAWARRAEGHRGGVAQSEPVDAAIEAYRAAIERDSSDLEARWKLMRALRFKGAYVARTSDAKKALFDEGRRIGRTGIEQIESALGRRGVSRPDAAPVELVAKHARSIEDAGELYLWDAIIWGEWAQVYGKLAAVRQGAADRIRRQTEIALTIDPAMEGAGPGRVLGRLHNQTPRVPFLTGWASDAKAVEYLRRSLELNAGDKLTMVFLAEALVANEAGARAEAVAILKKVLSTPNDPEFIVESESAKADARRLLDSWQ